MNIQERINNLMNKNKGILIHKESGETPEAQALTFFSNVYGYEKIKKVVYRSLIAEEQQNVLLYGSPAGGKSMFMKVIAEKCNDVLYFDATQSTSAGLVESLYENQTAKILLIDEIGLLRKNDLDALRGLLNDGRIVKTLKRIKYDFTMKNIKVFATTNDLEFSDAITSRFDIYHLAPYTDEEFVECVKFCLSGKFLPQTSEMIANVLIANNKKNIRMAISASRKILKNDSMEQIVEVIDTMITCGPTTKIDYN